MTRKKKHLSNVITVHFFICKQISSDLRSRDTFYETSANYKRIVNAQKILQLQYLISSNRNQNNMINANP